MSSRNFQPSPHNLERRRETSTWAQARTSVFDFLVALRLSILRSVILCNGVSVTFSTATSTELFVGRAAGVIPNACSRWRSSCIYFSSPLFQTASCTSAVSIANCQSALVQPSTPTTDAKLAHQASVCSPQLTPDGSFGCSMKSPEKTRGDIQPLTAGWARSRSSGHYPWSSYVKSVGVSCHQCLELRKGMFGCRASLELDASSFMLLFPRR